MATHFIIRKKFLGRTKINYDEMFNFLNLSVFKHEDNRYIFYNENKIGLGTLLDLSYKNQIFLLVPDFATSSEIDDLYRVIEYIINKMKHYEIYINGEYITFGVLNILKQKIVELLLENLNYNCKKTIDNLKELKLLFKTIEIDEEFRNKFSYATSFEQYENLIHKLQIDCLI